MVTERVEIIITSKGTRVVTRQIAGIGKTSEKAATSVNFLNRAVASLGSALVLRKLIRTADTYNLLQNRLRVVTDTSKELADVQQSLFEIADSSRSSIEGVVAIYSRFALALKDTNIEQRQLLNLTENVTKAAVIGGAAQAEARAGLIQLSQALASNRLSGDELRSVLEQLPVVAQKIAKTLGVGVGELRKLGEAGLLTRDVLIDAFGEVDQEIQEQFAKTVPTIAQSVTVLNNALIKSVGEFDNATGASAKFSKLLLVVSENLDKVALGVLTVGLAIATIKVSQGAAILFTRLGALSALKFTGLVAGLAGVFALMIKLRDTSKDLAANFTEFLISLDELLNERAVEVLKFLKEDSDLAVASSKNLDNQIKSLTRTLRVQLELTEKANQRTQTQIDKVRGLSAVEEKLISLKGKRSKADEDEARRLGESLTKAQFEQKVLNETLKLTKKEIDLQEKDKVNRKVIAILKDQGIISDKREIELKKKLLKEGVDPLVKAQKESNDTSLEAIRIRETAAELLGKEQENARSLIEDFKAIDLLLKEQNVTVARGNELRDEAIKRDEKRRTKREVASPLDNLLKDITDFSTQSEQILVNAFQGAEDALVQFVLTGKFNFSSLVDSILADLTRLLARQALAALIGALGDSAGGGGGAAGGIIGLLAGGRAGGGSVQGGRSFVVGERGPEIVNMPGNGSVTPNSEVGGASVTVVNVTDPDEITAAMSSADGEQVILNVIGRNKEAVKRAIS